MKKFISLAVALAMIISCVPMFGLTASAEVETYTLFDAADIDTSGHGDIDLADYGWTGNEGGVCFSSQWSENGTWNTSPWGSAGLMFFRAGARNNGTAETKVATFDNKGMSAGAKKIVIEYTFAMQDQDNNYQTWRFNDLDGNTFATLYYDQGVKAAVGAAAGNTAATDDNCYAKDKAAVYALRGKKMKIETVNNNGSWTTTYYLDGAQVGNAETIDSVNGFANITASVDVWNNQYAAMALLGLKITAEVDSSNIAEVVVKTVLSDGTPSGVEDKTILVTADGNPYTYVPQSTAPINVNGTYYIYNAGASKLTITPTVGGSNVIELVYDKFSGTGLTGSIIADGATCWFADPRTLTVKGDGVNYTYIGYIDNMGNVRATQYDNLTGDYEEVLVRSNLQPDDHNNPTFLELPDHKIMIFYSRHTDEACFYYRVSKEAYDITTFGEEHRLATENNTTYPNPVILESDPDHIYLTWRGVEWHPTIAQLEMPTEKNGYTTKFTWGPRQIVRSSLGSNVRPYAKYASNGVDKIWLTYTGTHPDNVGTNPIYCNYISIPDLTLHDVKGNVLSDLKSSTMYSVTGNETDPNYVVDRTNNYRDWVWEIALDKKDELPVIAMVKIDSSKKVHNYFYAKYTGSEWNIFDLPDPSFNTFFHQTPATENCYSGGMSIDKNDPHIVYASIPVDGVFGRVWEIVKWTLNDDYTAIEDEEFITENSEKDNARPYISNGSDDDKDLRLTWFNGDYYYWIHSNQHGGKGYPVQMMTTTELKEMPVNNDLGDVNEEVYAFYGNTETVSVKAGEEFTISMNILQRDMAAGGTLLKSGNLQIDLEEQTVDNTHKYAAVAPKITAGGKTEKSQNLLSDSAWYFSLGGTGGTKSQSNLGWFNYTVTYDGSEIVTYVNGLIDATVQGVDVTLGDEIEIGGISGTITNVRSTDKALTQAEVRAAAEGFDPDDVVIPDIPDVEVSVQFTCGSNTVAEGEPVTLKAGTTYTFAPDKLYVFDGQAYLTDLERSTLTVKVMPNQDNIVEVALNKAIISENKITNGDFADGTNDWTDAATGAQYAGTVSTNYVHGNGNSLTNTASNGGAAASTVRRYIPVTAGKTYYLSYYAYNTGDALGTGNNGAMSAFVPVTGKVFGAFGSLVFKDYVEYGGQNSWSGEPQSEVKRGREDMPYAKGMNHKEFFITVPEGADNIMISMFAWTAAGRLYFSDFVMYEVEEAPAEVSVEAEAALRIVDNADGTASLGLAFTADIAGDTYAVTAVGFEYGAYVADEDDNYTVLPETLKDAKFDGTPESFRLVISGISSANSARTYAVKPYAVVNGEKVYGDVVTATLYDALADSIKNGAGNTILPARLAAANSVIAFVKANRKADSEAKFPGLAEATAKLYENGELNEKAKGLGISDDASEIQLAEVLSLESVEIEFVETDIAESETIGDITSEMDFVPEI